MATNCGNVDSTRTANSINDVLTPKIINVISFRIAQRIMAQHSHEVDFVEARNWAKFGIAKAAAKFSAEKFEGTKNFMKRACGYLASKGFYLAIDEMRSTNVIARYRDGTFYGGTLISTRHVQVSEHAKDKTGDKDSHDVCNPDETFEIRDLVKTLAGVLPEYAKQILVRKYINGEELIHIAQDLGLSKSYVYTLHDRILLKLRNYLTGTERTFSPNLYVDAAAHAA